MHFQSIRRLILLLLAALLSSIAWFSSPETTAEAQGGRQFKPKQVTLTIPARQPETPDDALDLITYVPPITEKTTYLPSANLFWDHVPAVRDYPRSPMNITKCGYKDGDPPKATLTLPTGQKKVLEPSKTFNPRNYWCHDYEFAVEYGMLLGTYQFVLTDHPDHVDWKDRPVKSIYYIWYVDYATNPVALEWPDGWHLLMGFPRNSRQNLYFYLDDKAKKRAEFYASVPVQIGADGALLFKIQPTEKIYAPDDFMFVISGYEGLLNSQLRGDRLLITSKKALDTSADEYRAKRCESQLPSQMINLNKGRVTGGDMVPLRLRSGPWRGKAGDGREFGYVLDIPALKEFDILLADPHCDGAGLNWWKVNYRGHTGWVAESEKKFYYIEPLPNK